MSVCFPCVQKLCALGCSALWLHTVCFQPCSLLGNTPEPRQAPTGLVFWTCSACDEDGNQNMDKLIFKLSHTKTSTSLPGERQDLNPLGRAKPSGGEMGSRGPGQHCPPTKTRRFSTPCPKSKELEQMGRMLCSCAARCGTPQPLPGHAGCPHRRCSALARPKAKETWQERGVQFRTL